MIKNKNRLWRWFFQIVFLTIFIYLFVQTRYGTKIDFQYIFFRIDPLTLIICSITLRRVIWFGLLSIILLILTWVLGRFFCGFVCPLGTTIDIGRGLLSKCFRPDFLKKRKILYKNYKYLILIFLFISAILGSSFIHFFDPLIIFEKTLTLFIFPTVSYYINFFTNFSVYVYTETLISFVIFLIILSLEILTPRFWCRNFCPLGGLLALFSKFSLLKPTFVNVCEECSICNQMCPTDAIDNTNKKIQTDECICCLRCIYECPVKKIKYKINFETTPFNIKRREFIAALGSAIIFVPLTRFFLYKKINNNIIRPPGAIPEQEFLNLCLRCGKCMKICPTNGLQPCLLEVGINGIWTPRLVPRIGQCEKNCNMCGKICPTSAIRNLTLEEKTYVKIGTAVIDRFRCIAWEQNKDCLICDEACQYNAITLIKEKVKGVTLGRPIVDEQICTGCGICENRCPVEGTSAIQVLPIGEERISTGSYITEEKIKLRIFEDKKEEIPSGFIFEK